MLELGGRGCPLPRQFALGLPRAYNECVLLPFDRSRLAERNALDFEDDVRWAPRTPAEALLEALELSETVLLMATAAGTVRDTETLEDKARLYVRPLKCSLGR